MLTQSMTAPAKTIGEITAVHGYHALESKAAGFRVKNWKVAPSRIGKVDVTVPTAADSDSDSHNQELERAYKIWN